jgi:hypothetical protein
MRYLAFFIVMGLSITMVQRFDWPTWLQMVVILLANLVIGGAIMGSQEEAKREGEQCGRRAVSLARLQCSSSPAAQCHALLCHAMPCHALPCPAEPDYAWPSLALPRQALRTLASGLDMRGGGPCGPPPELPAAPPGHAMPGPDLPCRAQPGHDTPCLASPCHAKSGTSDPSIQPIHARRRPSFPDRLPNCQQPCRAEPRRATPCRAMPRLAVPRQALPGRASPSLAVPRLARPRLAALRSARPRPAVPRLA